jgi:sorbitol-specific phosphotransferase system component IIC
MMNQVDEHLKQTLDLVSITTVFGTLMGILPSIAALLSIVWSVVRLYETDTVQKLIAKAKGSIDDNSQTPVD